MIDGSRMLRVDARTADNNNNDMMVIVRECGEEG